MTLSAGLVGAGAVGSRHLSLLREFENIRVAAICDIVEDRAHEVATAVGAKAYADWHQLLDQELIDVLFVCTPPMSHAAPTVAALERGIHVYVEKPVARTLRDACAIVEAGERSGSVCAVGYQWRGLDLLDGIRDALGGRPVGLLISRSVSPAEHGRIDAAAAASPERPPWFLNLKESGGILLELGSHNIDLQLLLGGPVDRVQASAGRVALAQADLPRSEVDDALALVLHFTSGALGAVLVAWTGKKLSEFYELDILAPEATLRVTLDPEFAVRGAAGSREVRLQARTHPLRRSLARFLEAAGTGEREQVFCTPREAMKTLAVALACEDALRDGGCAVPSTV